MQTQCREKGALDEYLLTADDPRDEELEKEFTWYRVVYYVPFQLFHQQVQQKSKGLQGPKQAATIQFDEDRASERRFTCKRGNNH